MAGQRREIDPFVNYLQGSPDFSPYFAGRKVYGGGRSAPNIGPTTSPEGYRERDLKQQAMKNRMLKKLKKSQRGQFADPAVLRNMKPESYKRPGI